MKLYQLKTVHSESFTAWGKAPRDVAQIAENLGAITVDIRRYSAESKVPSKIQHALWFLRCCRCFGMSKNSACLLQHPFFVGHGTLARIEDWLMFKVFRFYHIRAIIVVHDIGHWRKLIAADEFSDETAFLVKHADCLIVHNAAMRRRLISEGVSEEKMIELGLFDYLINQDCPKIGTESFRQVIIAGNLMPDKVPYLRWLPSVADVDWHLYGKQFEAQLVNAPNIHYEGCYSSEEITSHLRNGFGLVWDGTSTECCTGNTGEYLRYNNPHKLSLYLASGLPVFVWAESATASFVREHDVGIAIRSLGEIGGILNSLTESRYSELCQKVLKISKALREGHFMSTALRNALVKVEREGV